MQDFPGVDDVVAITHGSGCGMGGSVYGCKPTPSLKFATNSPLFKRMGLDMDYNCGAVIDGTLSVAQAGAEIFQMMLETASGKPTRSEEHGLGDNEFVPWQLGAVM